MLVNALARGVTLAAATVLVGCGQTAPARPDQASPALIEGYTCCNLHYEDDWINDGNYAHLPMIPAGAPIRVTGYGRYRAYVEISGRKMRLGQDYGREEESTEQWVAKQIRSEDPKREIASFPPNVRAAIAAGQVVRGMTKEQVIMSLGHPLTSENRFLDAPLWRYWHSSFAEYQVHWGRDGRVSDITADELTRSLVEYKVR